MSDSLERAILDLASLRCGRMGSLSLAVAGGVPPGYPNGTAPAFLRTAFGKDNAAFVMQDRWTRSVCLSSTAGILQMSRVALTVSHTLPLSALMSKAADPRGGTI